MISPKRNDYNIWYTVINRPSRILCYSSCDAVLFDSCCFFAIVRSFFWIRKIDITMYNVHAYIHAWSMYPIWECIKLSYTVRYTIEIKRTHALTHPFIHIHRLPSTAAVHSVLPFSSDIFVCTPNIDLKFFWIWMMMKAYHSTDFRSILSQHVLYHRCWFSF